MIRILGIDPGTRITGYGIIDSDGHRNIHVESGCIRLANTSHPERLKIIFNSIRELIALHAPQELAVEEVFVHNNAAAALKLGQARGAAISACVVDDLPVGEYSPRSIKQAVVGSGKADKNQVQHMVRVLLNLAEAPQADAADALAVALCHGHQRTFAANVMAALTANDRKTR